MRGPRPTVERLDRPSAYYNNRVRLPKNIHGSALEHQMHQVHLADHAHNSRTGAETTETSVTEMAILIETKSPRRTLSQRLLHFTWETCMYPSSQSHPTPIFQSPSSPRAHLPLPDLPVFPSPRMLYLPFSPTFASNNEQLAIKLLQCTRLTKPFTRKQILLYNRRASLRAFLQMRRDQAPGDGP